MGFKFTPASLCVFREGYTRDHFFKDLMSGIIVGIVALPLAIAFAIASGVSPEQGIYTAVVAILLTTLVVSIFHLPVDTIGSRFGTIPTMLPRPVLPHVTLEMIQELISPALTIAMLAAIESLLSAVVADGITGDHHDSNMELVAQGIANIIVPIFGGIPATGAIARTATNIKSGGKTPVAGIVHAATLLLIMVLFGKWATRIPMATLAAILMVVAYHMSEWRYFIKDRG